MSPETPSPQQDDTEFSSPFVDQAKQPEFGSDELLEDAATDIDSHLDKIPGAIKIDNLYYSYIGPQSVCGEKASELVQTREIPLLRESFKSLRAIQQ